MKTNRRGPSGRLGLISVALLLLIHCSALSQAVDGPVKDEEVNAVNWLQITKDNWPIKEDTDGSPFYVLHSEFNTGVLFSLNASFFKDISLVSTAQLGFKYATASDATGLSVLDQQGKRTIETLPNTKAANGFVGWQAKPVRDLTAEGWQQLKFHNFYKFDLALKDIEVKYIEKLAASKETELSPLTGYKEDLKSRAPSEAFEGSSNVGKLDIEKITKIDPTKEATVQVIAQMQELDLAKAQENVTLRITLLPGGESVEAVCDKKHLNGTLTGKPATATGSVSVTCELETGKPTAGIKTVTVSVVSDSKQLGFVLSQITGSGKALAPVSGYIVSTPSAEGDAIFEVANSDSPSYITVLGSQPAGKDLVYSLGKPPGTPALDVYLTLDGSLNGIKLFRFQAETVTFALNEHLALSNLESFQLTLVGQEKVSKPFHLSLTSQPTESLTKDLIETPKAGATVNELGPTWYYYSSVLDFTLKTDKPTAVRICDIVTNCFPLEASQDGLSFSLADAFKSILLQSPLVRFQIDDLIAKVTFDTASVTAATNFEQFKTLNSYNVNPAPAQKDTTVPELTYTLTDTDTLTLRLPLNMTDLRVQSLKLSISKASPKDVLQVKEISFTDDETTVKNDLTDLSSLLSAQSALNVLALNTTQLFFARPGDVQPYANGAITLVLAVTPEKPKKTTQIRVKLTQSEVKVTPSVDAKQSVILPKKLNDDTAKNVDKTLDATGNIKFVTLKKGQSTAIVSTGILRTAAGLLSEAKYKVTLRLHVGNGSALNAENDFTIKRVVLSRNLATITDKTLVIDEAVPSLATVTDNFDDNSNDNPEIDGGAFSVNYVITLNTDRQVNLQVAVFEFTSPVNEQLTEPVTGPTVALFDPKYDQVTALPNFKFDNNVNTLDTLYQEGRQECDLKVGCANIFDRSLATSKLYYEASSVQTASVKYIPYLEKEQVLSYLRVARPKENTEGDFCVSFGYSGLSSPLTVSANGTSNEVYRIPFTKTVVDVAKERTVLRSGKVCASHLSNEVKGISGLYFRFLTFDDLAIGNHYVTELKHVDASLEKNTIPEGIYRNNSQGNSQIKVADKLLAAKMFIEPSPYWRFSNDGELVLRLTKAQLETLKKPENYGPNGTYVDFLRTKWIRKPTTLDALQLGFTPTGNLSSDFFTLSAIVSSPALGNLIHKSEKALLASPLAVFPVPAELEYYQLSLRAVFHLEGINENTFKDIPEVVKQKFEVRFKAFTLNDACVDEKNDLLVCTSPTNGACNRTYTDFTHSCACTNAHTGDSCQATDYCKMAPDASKPSVTNEALTCAKRGCLNDNSTETFNCNCPKNYTWDILHKLCVSTVPKACGENEVVYIATDGSQQCECSKAAGYLWVKNGTSSLCVKADHCNPKHRSSLGLFPTKPCDSEHAECHLSGASVPYCTCKEGFYSEHGNTKQHTNCLPNLCKSCEQACKTSSKGEYKCECTGNYKVDATGKCTPNAGVDVSKCVSNSTGPAGFLDASTHRCACPDGYKWQVAEMSQGCVLDSAKLGKLDCKHGVIMQADSLPGCKCLEGQKFDTTIRQCVNECTEEATKQCTDRKATCYFDGTAPLCKCSPGEHPFYENSTETGTLKTTDSWSCLAACDRAFELEVNNTNVKCNSPFQHCDGTKLAYTRGNLVTSKLLPTGVTVFVPGQSRPDSPLCQCDLGFTRNGADCEQLALPIRHIDGMQFDNDPTNPDRAKVEANFVHLISLLAEETITVKENECTLANEKWTCSITYTSAVDPELIKKRLHAACLPIGTEGHCSYATPKVAHRHRRDLLSVSSSAFPGVELKHDPSQDPTVRTEKPCQDKKNLCSRYPYSVCTDVVRLGVGGVKVNMFECLCGKEEYFETTMTTIKDIRVQTAVPNTIRMQTCVVKNMCELDRPTYGCTGNGTACHFHVEATSEGTYVPLTQCTCEPLGKTLVDRTLSCAQTCNGQCGNSLTCAYNMYDPAKIVCNCKQGWEGAKCDKKVDTTKAEETNKAYLISTIVVSVIAVIALIALAVLYFRKR